MNIESSLTSRLSAGEAALLSERLWQLFSVQAQRYTGGDSSSVTVETANELMRSLSFTLEEYLQDRTLPQSALLTGELDAMYRAGVGVIRKKLTKAEILWKTACSTAPGIDSVSYTGTLKGLGGFFKRYDCRYFAHLIPCDIDYQLCRPVSETLLGVEYVTEYLRRLSWENAVLRRFDTAAVIRLLRAASPDYRGLLVNLCEPVVINAAGLILLGREPWPLVMTDADRAALAEIFEPLPPARARELLGGAGGRLCEALGVSGEAAREYIAGVVADIYPRVDAAMRYGGLEGIFVTPE